MKKDMILNLEEEIEKARTLLNQMYHHDGTILSNDDLIAKSQELDKLLTQLDVLKNQSNQERH